MNRREFILGSVVGTAGFAMGTVPAAEGEAKLPPKFGYGRLVKTDAPPRNRRPYANVDWSKAVRVNTTSHGHCESQQMLDQYVRHKFGLIAISNYYPSAPRYPGKDFTRDYFRFHATHPVMKDGKLVPHPKDWNKELAGLQDKFRKDLKGQYPFVEKGEKMFTNWPADMLEIPNAEHHMFKEANGKWNWNLHMCAPGSFFASGTFDKWNGFGSMNLGYSTGCGEFWGKAVDRMINGLMIPDGGGVTVNHPLWTKIDRQLLLDILDWDPRVLGCEVLENGRNSEFYWDWVLSTGRQCFGFFVPDWGVNNDVFGVNVLLVPERTVEACLRAYRQGNWYGAAHGLGELSFQSIAFDGQTLRAVCDKPARFEVKTARGVVKETKGTEVVWEVPKESDGEGPKAEVFVRVKASATDGTNEVLFSQPFMLY